MEASGAGLAGSGGDAGQNGDAGQSGEQQGQQQQGQDFGPALEQLQSLQEGQEQLRQFLMSEPWQQQAQGEPQGQEDAGYPEFDLAAAGLETGDPQTDQQLAQTLMSMVDQAAQQQTQQHLAPIQQQIAEMKMAQEAEHLAAEFPEMAQPEVAQEVVSTAAQLAEQLGMPELANKPAFWRLAYMAGRAADAQAEEGADAPEAAHLEGGGGAGPAGVSQADFLKTISGADSKLGARVLPF